LIADAVGGRAGGGDHSPAASGPERDVSAAVGGGGSRAEGTGPSPQSVRGPPAEDVGFKEGQCHELDIFFEGLNILISTFCVYARMVFKAFQKLFITLYYYYLFICFFEILANFENPYRNPPQNFVLCDWSMFCNADLSLAAGKMRGN
jgi:hypothetical protein